MCVGIAVIHFLQMMAMPRGLIQMGVAGMLGTYTYATIAASQHILRTTHKFQAQGQVRTYRA